MYNLLENKILLVVDDDIINIALIYNYLKSYNANVTYLSNSQEVIPLLEKEKFDIIIMDVKMPLIDGIQLTTIIRNEMKLYTPIIILTASDNKKDFIYLSISDYIMKPFSKERLIKSIIKNIKWKWRLKNLNK